jgi:hypothetical protein
MSSGYSFIDSGNNVQASGGGNIFLTNTPTTHFTISNFHPISFQYVRIEFSMLNDTLNPAASNDLQLEASSDSGNTFNRVLPYQQLNGDLASKWFRFESWLSLPTNTTPFYTDYASRYAFRFSQTSSTRIIRLDDIHFQFAVYLPIKLHSFKAVNAGNKAIVKWKASSGSDKEKFILERSTNGESFSQIQNMFAKGNGEYTYEFSDELVNGQVYYRLKMVNPDGTYSYSKIEMVNGKKDKGVIFSLYPIPATNTLNVKLNQLNNEAISLVVKDAKGVEKISKSIKASNASVIQSDLSGLANGLHYLTIVTNDGFQTQKFVVAR